MCRQMTVNEGMYFKEHCRYIMKSMTTTEVNKCTGGLKSLKRTPTSHNGSGVFCSFISCVCACVFVSLVLEGIFLKTEDCNSLIRAYTLQTK